MFKPKYLIWTDYSIIICGDLTKQAKGKSWLDEAHFLTFFLSSIHHKGKQSPTLRPLICSCSCKKEFLVSHFGEYLPQGIVSNLKFSINSSHKYSQSNSSGQSLRWLCMATTWKWQCFQVYNQPTTKGISRRKGSEQMTHAPCYGDRFKLNLETHRPKTLTVKISVKWNNIISQSKC